jgi:hypothetical protein
VVKMVIMVCAEGNGRTDAGLAIRRGDPPGMVTHTGVSAVPVVHAAIVERSGTGAWVLLVCVCVCRVCVGREMARHGKASKAGQQRQARLASKGKQGRQTSKADKQGKVTSKHWLGGATQNWAFSETCQPAPRQSQVYVPSLACMCVCVCVCVCECVCVCVCV